MTIALLFGASNAFEVGKVGGSSQIRFDQSQERSLGQLEFGRLSPNKETTRQM